MRGSAGTSPRPGQSSNTLCQLCGSRSATGCQKLPAPDAPGRNNTRRRALTDARSCSGSAAVERGAPARRQSDAAGLQAAWLQLNQTQVEGILPLGEARTVAPPGLHGIGVRPRTEANPLEELEHGRGERLGDLGHRATSVSRV